MGYTTEFQGQLEFNKPLDEETRTFLKKLSTSRRMARKMDPIYGIEGEFYVDGGGFMGQDRDNTIIDYNEPPKTQPGLWCHWTPTEDGTALEWDGGEKFYNYVEWLEYIIVAILTPRKYKINGTLTWRGENFDDVGKITVKNNKITVKKISL